MSIRPPSRLAVGVAAAVVASLYLLAWAAVPSIVQSQAQSFVAEKTGHRLTMATPDFNPFTLALTLREVSLEEPDGKPLLAFQKLELNLSVGSLVRAAAVFDAIRLDGLKATIAELPGDRLNWSALLDAVKGKDAQPAKPAALPRIEIGLLSLSGGRIDLADRRGGAERVVAIDPIDLELHNLSTLPDDQGRYELTARTGFAESIVWRGEVALNPFSVTGQLSIEGISLTQLSGLVQLPPGMAPPEGTASLTTQYRVVRADDGVDLTLANFSAKIAGLKLLGKGAAEPALTLDAIEARDGKFDLRKRHIELGALTLSGGSLNLIRDTDGHLNLTSLLQSAPAKEEAPKAGAQGAPAAPWHYRVRRIAMADFRAAFRDEGVSPAADMALQEIKIELDDVVDDPKAAWPVRASLRSRDGGELKGEGKVLGGEPSVELQIKLTDLSLKPAQAYLGAATTLDIADGLLSGDGRAFYNARESGFQGDANLRNLSLTEGEQHSPFLKWKSLGARKLTATGARFAVADMALDGLDTRLLIAADKSTNLGRIVRKHGGEAPPAKTDDAPASATKPYEVAIDRLRVANSQLEFADLSLALPFGTHIHNLKGNLEGLSNTAGNPGRVELDGEVDDYGMARAFGKIDLFKPGNFTDLKVIFRNIEMTRLTPYSATFAGRRIDSGKLSLDLEYKIDKRQLSGNNQIAIDSLTLGERIESPQAKDLPLDLAIALLQDSNGHIDLGLPVSGNLDDPEFSYGQIVWKAFANVIGKAVTSPFRALGAIFGGEDGFEGIAFEPGRADLLPPEREKLGKLAAALGKRPKLALELRGTFAEADRLPLQDIQLRRALAVRLERPAEGDADPGPMPTDDPRVQAALEAMYAERIGKAELAAMRGPGMHAALYEKLRSGVAVTDGELQTLARTRGAAALAALEAAAGPAERITLLDPEKVEAENAIVPLKIEVKAAR